MKLITTNLKYNLPIIFFVLLFGSSFFYFSIKKALEDNVSEILKIRKEYVIDLINKRDLANHSFGNVYEYYIDKSATVNKSETIKDTAIYNVIHKEYLSYRELDFIYSKDNNNYHVSVRAPLIDNNLILKTVFIGILVLCLITSIVLVFLNIYISGKVWKPFYTTLKRISNFNLDNVEEFKPVNTKIIEFRELNNTLQRITLRLQSEYRDLKDFTTHLTHELQTPLSIISAHADLLLQTEDISEEQLKNINTIKKTVETISKFEDSLILLKRIELGEFNHAKKIELKEKLNDKLEQMEELFRLKEISCKKELKNQLLLNIDPQLIESLLNNLISNAIRHNQNSGYVEFSLIENKLQITNSKTIQSIRGADIGKNKSNGLGIGLLIVKAICEKYNFILSLKDENHDSFCVIIEF